MAVQQRPGMVAGRAPLTGGASQTHSSGPVPFSFLRNSIPLLLKYFNTDYFYDKRGEGSFFRIPFSVSFKTSSFIVSLSFPAFLPSQRASFPHFLLIFTTNL